MLPRVRACLARFGAWVVPEPGEVLSLEAVRATAAELEGIYAARWEAATLADLETFAAPAALIDARLLPVEEELIEAIQGSGELVAWCDLPRSAEISGRSRSVSCELSR